MRAFLNDIFLRPSSGFLGLPNLFGTLKQENTAGIFVFNMRMNDFKSIATVDIPLENIMPFLDDFTIEQLGHLFKKLLLTKTGQTYHCEDKETEFLTNVALHNINNFPTNKPHFVYVFRLKGNGEDFVKIGCTHSIELRKSNYEGFGYIVELIYSNEYFNKKSALVAEKRILKENSDLKYRPIALYSGFTECFDLSVLFRTIF